MDKERHNLEALEPCFVQGTKPFARASIAFQDLFIDLFGRDKGHYIVSISEFRRSSNTATKGKKKSNMFEMHVVGRDREGFRLS